MLCFRIVVLIVRKIVYEYMDNLMFWQFWWFFVRLIQLSKLHFKLERYACTYISVLPENEKELSFSSLHKVLPILDLCEKQILCDIRHVCELCLCLSYGCISHWQHMLTRCFTKALGFPDFFLSIIANWESVSFEIII